jgi:hypothetical protein
MKSMCCLCIQFTHENTSERTILHQVSQKNSGGGGKHHQTPPLFQVWLIALQKRLATPLQDNGTSPYLRIDTIRVSVPSVNSI